MKLIIRNKNGQRLRRAAKTRSKIADSGNHRISIHRSIQHMYLQLITPNGDKVITTISTNQKKRLLEIGVGSGCLIISVLKERINCSAFGIDCCKNAIKIAKINAKLHHVQNRINIFKTDVDNLNSGKYDLILSNPPYIDKHKLKYLGVNEYEPTKALNGGINGTEILIKVVKKSSKLLKINGKLIIEIGSDQKYKMINILKKNKFYINKITKDLSNLDRCITSTKIA